MTKAQKTFLEIVRDFGGNGEGWAEIELQYECRRISHATPPGLISSILRRVEDACARAGWIVREDDGPVLTEAGRVALVN